MRPGVSKPRLPILQKGHPLAQGLVGAWLAYEGAGLTARDVSGRGNHGALQGNVAWVTGRDGPRLDFPNTTTADHYILVPKSAAMDVDSITVVAGVVIDDMDSNNEIVTRWNASGTSNQAFVLQTLTSGLRFVTRDEATSASFTSVTAVNVGQKYNFAGVYKADDYIAHYIDGDLKEQAAAAGKLNKVTTPLHIGVRPGSVGTATANDWLDGKVDYASIYSRALPQSQIRALHADPYAAFRYQPRFWQVILDVAALPQRRRYKIVSGDAIVGSSVVKSN